MPGNTQVSFRTLTGTNQFYIQTATALPVPAAAWLFGSTVVGWLGIARRRLPHQRRFPGRRFAPSPGQGKDGRTPQRTPSNDLPDH